MEQARTIMVVGATGILGTEICRRLRAENRSVKALVRKSSNPDRVKLVRDMRIDTFLGDIKEITTLERVFIGVSTVISTVSSTFSRQGCKMR